jgi:hypothetical protein
VQSYTLITPLIPIELFNFSLLSSNSNNNNNNNNNDTINNNKININYCYKPKFCDIVNLFSWVETNAISCDDVKDHVNEALNKWQLFVDRLVFTQQEECEYYTHLNFTFDDVNNLNLLGVATSRIEYITIQEKIITMKYSEITLFDNSDKSRCLYWNNSFYRWIASFPNILLILLACTLPSLMILIDIMLYKKIVVEKIYEFKNYQKIILYFVMCLPQIFISYFYLFSVIILKCSPTTTTILHEIGHVMGLGHNQDKYGLMFPLNYPQTFPCIGEDERNGLANIFGSFYNPYHINEDVCIYNNTVFSYSVLWLTFLAIFSGLIITILLVGCIRYLVTKLHETIIFSISLSSLPNITTLKN